MDEKPKRRYLRFVFSLRTMFVVVTIFGVWLGWELRIVHERKYILRQLEQNFPGSFQLISLEATEADTSRVVMGAYGDYEFMRVSRIRRFLGDESYARIALPPSLEPQFIERAEHAFPEAALVIRSPDEGYRVFSATRDSLYAPKAVRRKNTGTVFKTGRID